MVAQTLGKVSCANPGSNAGSSDTPVSSTVVRAAMYGYTQRHQITNQLTNLAAHGCEVQVVYAKIGSGVLSQLTAAGVDAVQLSSSAMTYTGAEGGAGKIFVHDKYFLVSGALADGAAGAVEPNQNLVVTGSQNWTENGLHDNDEADAAVLQTSTGPGSTPVYDAYAANWDWLRQLAAASAGAPVATP
jgi:phosphatidylserine/phosphatidylglycerophosphate/cardiolipin synthase-like enzyme